MKIIHCADIHLASGFTQHFSAEQARSRNMELLDTFARMITYAQEEGVQAVLIAGDLFDTNRIPVFVRKSVLELIAAHTQIFFFYITGNHGVEFETFEEVLPANLKAFGKNWRSYRIKGEEGAAVTITGVELEGQDTKKICNELCLETEDFQIVMLHGQIRESVSGNQGMEEQQKRAAEIPLSQLRHKGIDYLALGHVHAYQKGKLDARGTYCYSGCLEGRGFDECGEHGFVLLDIDEKRHSYVDTFVPFASRHLYEKEVDVTGCESSLQMEQRIEEALQEEDYASNSMVRIDLQGKLEVTAEKNLTYLQAKFEELFFYFDIKDKTETVVAYETYAGDISLKGEFVRSVMKKEGLTEERRMEILQLGLRALAGEELFF